MNDDRSNHPPVSGQASPPPGPYPGGWGPPPPRPEWYPPPRRRGSWSGRPFSLIALLFVIAVLVVLLLAQLVGGGSESGAGLNFGKRVGVVQIEGVIFDSSPAIEEIHRCRDDDSITAVVIRVDSPGGTVGASQEIHNEVVKLAAKKPVVVSMGSVAASGGYYVSCPAKTIFANPGTITGSIGVVMEITNLEKLMDWLRVKNDVIKSGKYKDIGSPFRPMTDEERKVLQDFVDESHGQFEQAVADGRKLSLEDVHRLANGKIYTGARAKELGLVDELGNFWDAVDAAAKLGGVSGKPKLSMPAPRRPRFFLESIERLLPAGLSAGGRFESPVQVMYILNIE